MSARATWTGCAWLGIPLKIQKMEGPCARIIFLRIELDTITNGSSPASGEVGGAVGGIEVVERADTLSEAEFAFIDWQTITMYMQGGSSWPDILQRMIASPYSWEVGETESSGGWEHL